MLVYRITLEPFSGALTASGNPARWNPRDIKILYTASSRALACLENVVHRSGLGLQENFKTMVIEIPDNLRVNVITRKQLPPNWNRYEMFPATQALGKEWFDRGESAVLQVPSAIIAEEFNYLLNPEHPSFSRIRLLRTEPFVFDPRIKK